ncbi:hypothetical protein T01_1678 [Trichinella spiralis]|uniref:Uncharacterized protein n=2 Tax=Trichinella spiralis TaxID=6334 RepID=A0A0V1B8B5_TRISP|nr:hypothetical protein T01_1678 [Trichinella spiralis]
MVQKNIFWTIHVAVVNGWLQYKRDLKTSEAASGSQKDLMQFTLDVAETLTKVNKAYPRKSHGRMCNFFQQKAGKKTRAKHSRQIRPGCTMARSHTTKEPMPRL